MSIVDISKIKFSKIKPGDKVTLELDVLNVDSVSMLLKLGDSGSDWHRWYKLGRVVGHTPAPREIKVGDEIPGSMIGCLGASYKVLGIDAGWVWFGGYHAIELSTIRSMQAAGR